MENHIKDMTDLCNKVYMLRCLCNVVTTAVSDYDSEQMEKALDNAAGNLLIMQEQIEEIDNALENWRDLCAAS